MTGIEQLKDFSEGKEPVTPKEVAAVVRDLPSDVLAKAGSSLRGIVAEYLSDESATAALVDPIASASDFGPEVTRDFVVPSGLSAISSISIDKSDIPKRLIVVEFDESILDGLNEEATRDMGALDGQSAVTDLINEITLDKADSVNFENNIVYITAKEGVDFNETLEELNEQIENFNWN